MMFVTGSRNEMMKYDGLRHLVFTATVEGH